MSAHPLVMSIWLLDGIAWAIFLASGLRLLAALPHWRPSSGDAGQLRRERSLELVTYMGHWVMGLQAAAFGLMLFGVSNVWPSYVPGAMCGTGVLQAMGAAGGQNMWFRGLALLLLYAWWTAERLDRSDPLPVSAPFNGRLLLIAGPPMVLSTWTYARAVAGIDGPAPVSCCAVLYDQAGAGGWLNAGAGIPSQVWAAACFGGAVLVAGWGWLQYRRPRSGGRWFWSGPVLLIPAWAGAAIMGLKTAVAPYVFEVLYHPCPWCFFLWDHHAPGIVLFGLPAWVVAEGAAGLTAHGIGRRTQRLAASADARIARAGLRVTAAALLFIVFAAAPALLWRLRFGGWMSY